MEALLPIGLVGLEEVSDQLSGEMSRLRPAELDRLVPPSTGDQGGDGGTLADRSGRTRRGYRSTQRSRRCIDPSSTAGAYRLQPAQWGMTARLNHQQPWKISPEASAPRRTGGQADLMRSYDAGRSLSSFVVSRSLYGKNLGRRIASVQVALEASSNSRPRRAQLRGLAQNLRRLGRPRRDRKVVRLLE